MIFMLFDAQIKVYAASKYHDHPLEFANPYYVQTRTTSLDENVRFGSAMVLVLAITLTLGVCPITILYIYPIVVRLITKEKVNINTTNQSKKRYDYKNLIHWIPLTCTGVTTCTGFAVISIFATISSEQYSEDVLIRRNHHILAPYTNYLIGGLILGTIMIFTVIISAKRLSKSKKVNSKQRSEMVAAGVISVNIIYIGCIFFPTMLAAFVHSPLLTIFTYLMEVLFVVSFYLICLGVWRLYKLLKNKKYKKRKKVAKFLDTLLFCCMGWGIALSIIILIITVLYVITLGRFDDFKELKSLAPSLLIAAFGLVLLKPTYNYVTNKIKDDNSNGEPMLQRENNTRQEQNLPITNNPVPSTIQGLHTYV